MLVLLVASALRHRLPSIVFEQPNQLAELHSPILPGLPAGPCLEESGDGERRPGDDTSRVRQRWVRPIGEKRTAGRRPRNPATFLAALPSERPGSSDDDLTPREIAARDALLQVAHGERVSSETLAMLRSLRIGAIKRLLAEGDEQQPSLTDA